MARDKNFIQKVVCKRQRKEGTTGRLHWKKVWK